MKAKNSAQRAKVIPSCIVCVLPVQSCLTPLSSSFALTVQNGC